MNVFGVGLFLVTLMGAWDLALESGETRAKIVTPSNTTLTSQYLHEDVGIHPKGRRSDGPTDPARVGGKP